jgi:O-antigen ligase
VVIGTVVAIGATSLLVSARLSVIFLVVLVAAWFWARWSAADFRKTLPEADGLSLGLGVLLLYALASSLWSVDTAAAIGKVLCLAAVVIMSLMTARLAARESRAGALRIGEGLWLGLLIGLVFYLIEAATDQSLKIWIINAFHVSPEILQPSKAYTWSNGKLTSIGDAALTRNATPITLLLWPGMMAALGAIARPWNTRIALLLLALAIPTVFLSPQESSKTAVIAGLLAFGLAWLSSRWSWRLIATAWVMACLGIVPAAIVAYRLDLHHASWLQDSARYRIVIWNQLAERTLLTPIAGTGAYSIYVLEARNRKGKGDHQGLREAASGPPPEIPPAGEPFTPYAPHAHNVYLQVWLELGAVGALLLMAAGLQIIAHIRRLSELLQPFAFATFCSAATLMASSYGMWQSWYMALLALTPVLFASGARALETTRAPDHSKAAQ